MIPRTGSRPVIFRERAGFQSNAQAGGAHSTGNLRVRAPGAGGGMPAGPRTSVAGPSAPSPARRPYDADVASGDRGGAAPADDVLVRELSTPVAADGGAPGPVRSLVHVPRDAAAGRVRAPLVVCCHGLGESGLRVAPVARRLARAGAVAICPSFRGGGAPTAGATTSMSVLTEVADLEAVLDAALAWPFVDAGRTALFGRSLGGLVALLTATRRPAQTGALVLWYPALRAPATVRARFGTRAAVPGTYAARVDGRDIVLGRRYALDAWDLDVDAALRRLRAPVLLLHGDRDADAPIEASEAAARILPDARLERVAGAAHGFGDERLTAALERTARFLAWSGVLESAGEPQ